MTSFADRGIINHTKHILMYALCIRMKEAKGMAEISFSTRLPYIVTPSEMMEILNK